MRIQGKFKADITALKISLNKDTNRRQATVVAVTRLDRDGSDELFGHEFNDLVFRGVSNDDRASVLGFREMKPACVCEMHEVSLCGHKRLAVQPEIIKVNAAGFDEVLVTLYLPLTAQSNTMLGDLCLAVGESRTIELLPAQAELPLGSATEAVCELTGKHAERVVAEIESGEPRGDPATLRAVREYTKAQRKAESVGATLTIERGTHLSAKIGPRGATFEQP